MARPAREVAARKRAQIAPPKTRAAAAGRAGASAPRELTDDGGAPSPRRPPRATGTAGGGARGTSADTADQAGSFDDADHNKPATNLMIAVQSIPAYIERATLLLVLVPTALHVDRQEACNFATWSRRGWCRLELQASLLKAGKIATMICQGSEAL